MVAFIHKTLSFATGAAIAYVCLPIRPNYIECSFEFIWILLNSTIGCIIWQFEGVKQPDLQMYLYLI